MTEKLDFIDQTYSFEASKYDFKTIYKDMNMMFTWKDKKFYGSNANGVAEMYNDILKEKKYYPLAINDIFYGSNIPTGTPRRLDVDWMWILHGYVEDQISTNFHVISTYFFRCYFDGRKIDVVSKYFFSM